MKEITETEQIALGKYRRSGWCIQFRCIRTPFHWLLNGAGTIACGTTSRYNLDAIGLCRSDQSAIIQLVSLFFCLSFGSPSSTLHHTSDFIIFINRCSHFHAIILPFSVIYLLFGHFSYVVRFKFSFFIHSFDLFCKTFPFDLPPSTFSAHTNTSMYIFCVVFRFSVKISITFQCDLWPYWTRFEHEHRIFNRYWRIDKSYVCFVSHFPKRRHSIHFRKCFACSPVKILERISVSAKTLSL